VEQWKQDSPLVDLADFPITALHAGAPDDGPHTIRGDAICRAVEAALKLPSSVGLSPHAQYASLRYCSAGGPGATEYRIRINGFAFGEGSKKALEYLAISVLGLRGEDIVAWSEDVQKPGDSAKDWEAFHAGKYPGRTSPPPKKGSPKGCGRLSFVGADGTPIRITPELRALVAAKAKATPQAGARTAQAPKLAGRKPR
jgi:hypothetical protein